MTRKTISFIPPLAGVSFACGEVTVHDDGSVSVAGATVGTCTTAPPPPPPVDPLALATAQVIFQQDGRSTIINSCNMRDALQFLGRGNATHPPVSFPGCVSAFQFVLPRGVPVRARLHIPADMPEFTARLQAVSYYDPAHPLPAGWAAHKFRAAIVPAGADWSAANADAGSYRENLTFQEQLVLQFGLDQPVSTARAELARNRDYDLLLAWMDPEYGGGMVFQYNPSFQGH